MKFRILLLLMVVVLFQTISFNFAQDYHPFPSEDARWYTRLHGPACGFTPQGCVFSEVIISGDTLIDGKLFSKLVSYYQYEEGPINSNYIGAIRNGENRKVYYLASGENSDQVMYDFDLDVNDIFIFERFADTVMVISIDSILIGSEYRRKINFENIGNYGDDIALPYSIIEGIGSTNGLNHGSNFYTGFEDGYFELTCFWEYGDIIYESGAECKELTAVQLTSQIPYLNVFPNPTSDYFSIDQPGYPITVQVISLAGEVVFTRQYTHHDKIMVPVGDLSPGTYLVRLITSDLVSVQKLSVVK